ncbi:ribonuclease H-like domain-containing protein [Tanacetum coccineum]
MSTHDKNGLGFGTQMDDLSNKSETDSENSLTIFEVRSSDEESTLENNRFIKANEYHAVPPPITGNPLTPRPDISFAGLDEYAFRNKIIESKTTETNKTVDDEDDECADKTVSSVKPNVTQAVRSQADKSDQTTQKQGIGFKKVHKIKACFICKSTGHLIKDYDFYDQKSPEPRIKNVKYPHAKRTFNPSAVLTRAGLVNTVRSNVSTARSISIVRPVRPVSTARLLASKIALSNSVIRPNHPRLDIVRPKASNSPIKGSYFTQPVYRPKDLKPDVKTFGVKNMTIVGTRAVVSKGKVENVFKKDKWVWRPKMNYQDHVYKYNSSYMLKKFEDQSPNPNPEILYEDLNEGFVAFRSDPKEINNGAKLLDESQVVHSAPRKDVCTLGFKNMFLLESLRTNVMNELYAKKGIKREFSIARTPQQNGVAERKNQTLIEAARTILTTPIESNKKPLVKDEDGVEVDVHEYRSMIGSLMYLTASRSDIMFVVCACARDSPFGLEAFPDSDYAGASLDRKSTTGGCQFIAAHRCRGNIGAAVDQSEGSAQPSEPHHTPIDPIPSTSHSPHPSPQHSSPPHPSPQHQSPPHSPLHYSPYQSPPHSPHPSPPQPSPFFPPNGNAVLTLVKKVKSLETTLKRKSKKVIVSESESEESEDQGRMFQDIDDDPLGEFKKKNQPIFEVGKKQSWQIQLIYGLTGSTKIDSSTASERGQREGKAPMVEENIQATHKTKEQLRQEEAGLEEAIKLQAQLDEEVAKQIHLDKMVAQRMAEEEVLSEQQKKRKAQVQFEAQFYTEEDWDTIRAKLEANVELSKDVLGQDLPEQNFSKRMVDMVNQRTKTTLQRKVLRHENYL